MAYGTILGIGAGALFGSKKGDEAEELARREAELRWMATQEEVRRMEETHEQIIGQAKADVGSSGFATSSTSQEKAITSAETEMQRQRDITLALGEAQYELGLAGASQVGGSMTRSGILSGIQLGSSVEQWFK